MERETSGQDAPACRPPPLFSLSTAGGRQAGKRRETTLISPTPSHMSVVKLSHIRHG